MIEVILQNRESGLFLSQDGHWAELSRDALLFVSAREALRFAEDASLSRFVRAVVRVRRDKHFILMPLFDFAEDRSVHAPLRNVA